jgi:hypothetical protein
MTLVKQPDYADDSSEFKRVMDVLAEKYGDVMLGPVPYIVFPRASSYVNPVSPKRELSREVDHEIPKEFKGGLENIVSSDKHKSDHAKSFAKQFENYLKGDGNSFNTYLKSKGRSIDDVAGVGSVSLRKGALAAVIFDGKQSYVVGNGSDEDLKSFAKGYSVSDDVAKLYLNLHEHAHLSQRHLRRDGSIVELERDVEKVVGEFADEKISDYRAKGDLSRVKFYSDVKKIANQRFHDVHHNYGVQQKVSYAA